MSMVSTATIKKTVSPKKRWTLRNLLIPVALLGLFGLAVNYYSLPFLYFIRGSCEPHTNIVFLKTHKCASSTVQNILMRFGDTHNLTFVLPEQGNYLGHPAPFNENFISKPKLKAYNILAHHTRFNYYAIKRIMQNKTFFITIVRDPVEVFESSYAYYELNKFFGMNLQKFASLPISQIRRFAAKRSKNRYGFNQMMFDLGAAGRILTNTTMAKRYVDRLESWFDYVLVAERMDESLILLKDLLCWKLDDVISFKLNARYQAYKSNLTELQKANIRAINFADQILYDRFSAKLERQIKEFGRQRIAEQSDLLRQKRNDWYNICVRSIHPMKAPINSKRYYNPRVMTFEIQNTEYNETCQSLTREELDFTEDLIDKQKENLNSQETMEPSHFPE